MGEETRRDDNLLAGFQRLHLGQGIGFDAFTDNIRKGFVQLYEGSFPKAERRELHSIDALLSDPESTYSIRIYLLDHRVVAFVTTHKHESLTYVEHLCVTSRMRGGGLGREILVETITSAGTPVVLEVDPPDTDEWSTRRIAFYERAGFKMLNVEYLQPPYREGEPSFRLELMAYGTPEQEEMVAIIQSFYPPF